MVENTALSENNAWRRALELTVAIGANPSVTLPVVIDRLAERHGAKAALISDRQSLSYRELADTADGYARWAVAQGIRCGDVVALLMRNQPEYLAIWLGITRIGGVVALLNTSQVGSSLAHSIGLGAPKHLIVDAAFENAFLGARPHLDPAIRSWAHGGDISGLPSIEPALRAATGTDITDRPLPLTRDPALHIYTSGTTGLPKAAIVTHRRVMQWSHWFAGITGAGPDDRLYNCLPMYHSIGGVVATVAPLVVGGSVVIRERFSASRFWDDVVGLDCTMFQYIGELCRYLVNAPPQQPREAQHRLRLCCGNGLRPDIWSEFQSRFRIPQILEFYAATEGTFSLYNCEGKPGSIGRIPPFLSHRIPVSLIRIDVDTGEPERDGNGFCIRCAAGEPGEAIGRVADGGTAPGARFEGYTDAEASERKILRNVFAAGDAWFRTGDLMRRDAGGYFYFIDRIGDTFRWKGENVSTAEVAEAITACPGVLEAVVYGVGIPGMDGRAGMAALVTGEDFKVPQLREHLAARLPEYAQPVFLRILPELATTGTFKPTKQVLVGEGYDPVRLADELYVYDRLYGSFLRLDADLHRRLTAGSMRL